MTSQTTIAKLRAQLSDLQTSYNVLETMNGKQFAQMQELSANIDEKNRTINSITKEKLAYMDSVNEWRGKFQLHSGNENILLSHNRNLRIMNKVLWVSAIVELIVTIITISIIA
jgi:hypothetical protein